MLECVGSNDHTFVVVSILFFVLLVYDYYELLYSTNYESIRIYKSVFATLGITNLCVIVDLFFAYCLRSIDH